MSLNKTVFRRLIGAAALALGLSASAGHAVTLDVFRGQLVGASDVNVGGWLFDVSFQDGSCAGLFGGCDEASDFAFTSTEEAQEASLALLDQVLVDSRAGDFDSETELTQGITSTFLGVILTPFDLSGTTSAIALLNRSGSAPDGFFSAALSASVETTSGFFTYAVWTPTGIMAPVPVPPAVLMLLTGLAGVFSLRFRKRRVA